VRGYGGDLGETLGAGAALNRAGLGLDVRVGADAVWSDAWPGSVSDLSLARGEDGPDMRDPPASEWRRGERKRGWAGGACCAHEILGQSEAPWPRKREGERRGASARGPGRLSARERKERGKGARAGPRRERASPRGGGEAGWLPSLILFPLPFLN
jgi:hypothetical protein